MILKRIAPIAVAAALFGLLPAGAQAQRGFFNPFANPFTNPFARSRPLPAFGNPFAIRSIGPNQVVSVYTPNGFVNGFINQNGPYVPQPMPSVEVPVDVPGGNPAAGPGVAPAADNTAATAQTTPTVQPDPPSRNGTVKVNGDNVNITVNRDRYGKTPIARASETVEAKIEKDNRLAVTWSGDAASVARVRFILLDKDRKVIKEEVVAQVPATARFTLTNRTAFYQVQVEYVNGTTTSVISPI
jgi:hypothetical protein